MLARQRCGGGHTGRRFLGYSSKAPLVRRCIALGQTAGSGLRHYQPARGGAHRGCPESRDLRQRQLSAAAVWPPRSRLTANGQHAGSGRAYSLAAIGPAQGALNSETHQRASESRGGVIYKVILAYMAEGVGFGQLLILLNILLRSVKPPPVLYRCFV